MTDMHVSASVAPAAEAPSFAELGLSEEVLAAVGDLGYEVPSPVQAEAIPQVLAGRDLLAAAQTGTGKTAAFLLPVLSRLAHCRRHEGPALLVVTPTRELAQQIADVCATVERRTHHRSVTVVGGVGYEPQKAALARGCDVLVATPGRLVDLIEQGCCDLSGVDVLVLDEADRMLDMGFLPAMRRIVGQTPASRQTLLFSATLDEDAIGGIRDLVRDPAVVEIAHKGTVAETIDQYALPVSLEAKNALLAPLVLACGPQRVIVFTRTKHRADACCRRLRRAGVSCAPIHGNRSQNQRERALAGFRSGEIDVLVATDVLARGIDVSDVRYVVNFDVPADPEDYIHRIGRTGRAEKTGWALTLVTTTDFDDLRGIERLMGQVVPTWPRAGEFELGAELPELDPAREAVPSRRGGAAGGPASRRRRGRGARADAAEQVTAETTAAPARESAGKEVANGPRPSRRRRSRGARTGAGTGAKAAPEPARPEAAPRRKAAAPDGASARPARTQRQRSGQAPARPSSGAAGSKPRAKRRPGDQAGRKRGIN